MHANTHTRALEAIDGALQGGPWREGQWDERARRFGTVMLEGLRESLPSRQVATSVAAGFSAARSEFPLASSVYHETWGRVVLVWVVREVLRVARDHPSAQDEFVRAEIVRIAAELIAAANQLNVTSQDTSAWGGPVPFDRLVDTARDALTAMRDALPASDAATPFMGVYVHQIKHIMSLLAVGGHSVDSLVRGAIIRTDRIARKDSVPAWDEAPLATRRVWVGRGLIDAAWALAAAVPKEYGRADHSKEVCLWLARTACQLAARVERVETWVPTVREDIVAPPRPKTPGAPAPALAAIGAPSDDPQDGKAAPAVRAREARMETKTQNIIKTLEVDASDAAWRLAGSQFVKLARDPIVALLSRHLGPDDEAMRGKVAAFLETDLGTALLASLLSMGLSAVPTPPGSDIPQRLSRELRVKAMADAGDVIADVLMGPLRQVVSMYLQNVGTAPAPEPARLPPANEQARISLPAEDSRVVEAVPAGERNSST